MNANQPPKVHTKTASQPPDSHTIYIVRYLIFFLSGHTRNSHNIFTPPKHLKKSLPTPSPSIMAPEVSAARTPAMYPYSPSSTSSSSFSSYSSSFQPCTVPPNFLASLGEADRRVARYILEQTEKQERVAEAQSVSRMLIDAVERIGAERNCGGLEASKWATDKSSLGTSHDRKNISRHKNHSNHNNINNVNSTYTNPSAFYNSHSNSSSSSITNICGQKSTAEKKATKQSANVGVEVGPSSVDSKMASEQKWAALVDDTDAFMNAIASLPAIGAKPPAAQSASETGISSNQALFVVVLLDIPSSRSKLTLSCTSVRLPSNVPAKTPVDPPVDAQADTPDENTVEEDREHQLTFSSWGAPTARTGPGKTMPFFPHIYILSSRHSWCFDYKLTRFCISRRNSSHRSNKHPNLPFNSN